MKTVLLLLAVGGVGYLVYKKATKNSPASLVSQIKAKYGTALPAWLTNTLSVATLQAILANGLSYSNAETQALIAAAKTA